MSRKDKDSVLEDQGNHATENPNKNSVENSDENIEHEVEDFKELTIEEQLHEDLAKEKDKFMRLFAEFENYKRRTSKERIELFKTAGQDIMVSLLPVLDDFERALLHIEDDKEAEELRKGVLLIYNKLINTLKQKGLEVVELDAGDSFDADVHEAVTHIPAPEENLRGKIVDVVEKGYKLGEKIIRFPKVVVGK